MGNVGRVGDLEIAEDLDFQRRSWRAQRVGWIVLGLILVGAVAGLFGPGLLGTSTTGSSGDSVRVEYYRFWRKQSGMPLRIHLSGEALAGGEARVWLSRTYVDAMSISGVTPQPESVELGPDRLTYVLKVDSTGRAVTVSFDVEPEHYGIIRGRAGLDQSSEVRFNQFIYP